MFRSPYRAFWPWEDSGRFRLYNRGTESNRFALSPDQKSAPGNRQTESRIPPSPRPMAVPSARCRESDRRRETGCRWARGRKRFSRIRRAAFSLLTRPFVLAFVCTDDACSWESREAWEPHLLRFKIFETGVRDHGSQLLHAAPPGVKSRSLARSFLLALEIGNDQASPWFEHPTNFSG